MLNQLAIAEVGNPMLGNIIVVSGSFLILMFLLKHFAWGPISDILKKREDKIANDLDSAEKSRINSAKMEQEREQQLLASRSDAADIIKNAKESGELSRQNILKETQEEVARLKSKAQTDIMLERDTALNSVKDDVADLSLQIAAKILNKELSPEMHESLINQYIEGLGSTNETR
ncbi:F0F1 ATP synthase subunit B [Enterococcus hirae]|uniref:F0F1 ATP synthase subunit B n=1 Tax=Enterococcus sp. C63 TaxID=3231324 RepID=UPI0019EF08C1|nr:F0F1 ATP synthase subunit B [Enterococcus hirae]EMF0129323.1 F0F1 ATP synthase subunit B [Enterococcus hirae]EMF0448701.1 F0F1 ATP synthase subunit B [Enterococcus hirae]EMF0515448.1 F0F1 ATP synthase subunit B [Enterococcus hirae]EMF0517846.1 F0F1 ATP synthase subunit B [Enterococcus hirae]